MRRVTVRRRKPNHMTDYGGFTISVGSALAKGGVAVIEVLRARAGIQGRNWFWYGNVPCGDHTPGHPINTAVFSRYWATAEEARDAAVALVKKMLSGEVACSESFYE